MAGNLDKQLDVELVDLLVLSTGTWMALLSEYRLVDLKASAWGKMMAEYLDLM